MSQVQLKDIPCAHNIYAYELYAPGTQVNVSRPYSYYFYVQADPTNKKKVSQELTANEHKKALQLAKAKSIERNADHSAQISKNLQLRILHQAKLEQTKKQYEEVASAEAILETANTYKNVRPRTLELTPEEMETIAQSQLPTKDETAETIRMFAVRLQARKKCRAEIDESKQVHVDCMAEGLSEKWKRASKPRAGSNLPPPSCGVLPTPVAQAMAQMARMGVAQEFASA